MKPTQEMIDYAIEYAQPEIEARKLTEQNREGWERRAAKAEAALRHIAEYPNITAAGMRDCAREALK